jgi:hypothetical protein
MELDLGDLKETIEIVESIFLFSQKKRKSSKVQRIH